ncbi:MAG: Rpp14/Pop5 family protein [Thermoplasmata archaeon]
MSGKVERGKWRYIAFRIDADRQVTRRDIVGALLEKGRTTPLGDSFRLTVFERDIGILKVPHTMKDEAIKVMRSVDTARGGRCTLTTLKTSGTIRKLKEACLKDLRMLADHAR